MTIDINEYLNRSLPGCETILLEAENYIDFRNRLIEILGTKITPSKAIGLYETIADQTPTNFIDAREYVLNELQYEIRRTQSETSSATPQGEGDLLEKWAKHLSERFDSDDILDLINHIKTSRVNRKNKH